VVLLALTAGCAPSPEQQPARVAAPAATASVAAQKPPLPPKPGELKYDREHALWAAKDALKALLERGLLPDWAARSHVEPPGQMPRCEIGRCTWSFAVSVSSEDSLTLVGALHLDATTYEALWEPNDGRNRSFTIEAFAAYDRDRRRVEGAVTALPEVKAFCERLQKVHKLSCALWAEQEPEDAACGPNPSPIDPCLWSVYLGEIHEGSHATRSATFYVDTAPATVVGVSPLECEPMTLSAWQAYTAKKNAGRKPRCPEGVVK
jgi:hypothetical protein